jgi:hypothetical protein
LASISENPMIALSGVRSSWLMVARKRLLAAFARTASSRASSRARSWPLRSVTSRITATTSRSLSGPSARSSGRQRISTQMNWEVSGASGTSLRMRNSTELLAPLAPASLSAVR